MVNGEGHLFSLLGIVTSQLPSTVNMACTVLYEALLGCYSTELQSQDILSCKPIEL